MESSNVCIICGIALPEQGPSICEHDAEMLSLQIEEIKRLVSSTEEKINSLKVGLEQLRVEYHTSSRRFVLSLLLSQFFSKTQLYNMRESLDFESDEYERLKVLINDAETFLEQSASELIRLKERLNETTQLFEEKMQNSI